MEDKIKNKLIEDLQDNKELKNTINFEGTDDYNVNAVTAEVARHTMADLTIKESGVEKFKFDGSTDREIDYVSTDGGTFKGHVYLDRENGAPTEDEIITYGQISNEIAKLTGSPVYTWGPSSSLQLSEVKNSEGQIEKLTTIVGTAEDFEDFKRFARPTSSGLAFNSSTGAVSGIGTCTDTEILLPTEVEVSGVNKEVKSINGSAFNPTANSGKAAVLNAIKSVVIPYGIESIGDSAFKTCTGLTYVSIPESVKILGANQTSTIFHSCSALSTVRLCNGLETIGASTFYNCSSLENISIPSSVRNIGSQAFYGCAKLTEIAIPNSVSTIEHSTFNKCSNLKSIYIPNTVTEIKYNAFSGCDSLVSVVFGGTADQWKAITKGNAWDYHAGYNYSDKTNTNYIHYNVYCTDKYLTKAGIESTEYTEYAYNTDNESMTHYTVPNANDVLSNLNIETAALKNLTSVTIPSNIKTINANVFSACSNLAIVYYEGSLTDWNNITIEGGNDSLLKAKLIALTDSGAKGSINTADIANSSFMYICKDVESATLPVSNKVFLKFSADADIIEISKGAARLESTEGAITSGYYTYDTLAAVIAGINSRLTALGSDELALPDTLKVSSAEHTIVPELPEEITAINNKVIVAENVVPSVQELKQAIDTIGSEDGIERGEDGKFRLNEEFYKYLLKQTFKTPSISSFSLTGTNTSGSKEVGTTVTVTGIKHQETNTGNITGNLTLSRSSGAGASSKTVSTSIAKSSSSADVTVSDSFTASSSGTVTYTLSAPYKDTTGAAKTATKTASVSFYWPVYYGATSSKTPSNQNGLENKGSSFGSSMLEIPTDATNKHIHFLSTGTIKLYNSLKLPITPGATGTVSITVNSQTTTYNYATIQNCGVGTQKIYVNI